MQKQKGNSEIGRIKWSAYDADTMQLLSHGERILYLKDVVIKPIQELHDKRIELGNHFNFGLVDSSDRQHGDGFGLCGLRDDEKTFSWDWFEVDQPGHAKKLQESGELSFDTKKTPNGNEIDRMEFLTDVSIRVSRMTDSDPLNFAWRIQISKGSVINWPALVNGEVV